MPGNRSYPTQNVQNCPFIPGPTNPLGLSPVEKNTDQQRDVRISNPKSFLLAWLASCALTLPVVPEPQSAFRCPVCLIVVELPCFKGDWENREVLISRGSFGLCEQNRHLQKAVCCLPQLWLTVYNTFYKAAVPMKELGSSFLKNWFLYYLIPLIILNCSYNLSLYISH